MALNATKAGVIFIEITGSITAGVNVPSVLPPYQAVHLRPDHVNGQILVSVNGVPQRGGAAAGAGIDVYPGDVVSNGDLKFAATLNSGDHVVIQFVPEMQHLTRP